MQRLDSNIVVRAITPADAAIWEAMRRDLWPDGAEDHGPEIAMFFAGHYFKDLTAVFIAEDQDSATVGFAELSIRHDVTGLNGMRTGYVEGLYVLPKARNRGVALKLLRACQQWAHEQRCVAFASDRTGRIIFDRSFALGAGQK